MAAPPLAIPEGKSDEWAFRLALLSVATAIFSRPIVAWGLLPGVANFVHLPLSLLAFLMISHKNSSRLRRMLFAIVVFAGFSVFSGAVNDVELARSLAALLLWLEPVLIIYVCWSYLSSSYGAHAKRLAKRVLILTIAAQYVFMSLQIPRQLTIVGADEMQGTFVGSGTGAHVAPSVVLIGVVLLLERAFTSTSNRWRNVFLAFYGVALAQLASARAVTLVFVAAIAIGLGLFGLERHYRKSLVVAVTAVIGVAVWLTLPLVASVPDLERQRPGWDLKLFGVQAIMRDAARDPAYLVVGQGPGMTLSRVAMQTPGANLNPDSPIARLGFETSDFTRELVARQSTVAIGASSLFAPSSSFAGLVGDLGVIGLSLYLAMWTLPVISSARAANAAVPPGYVVAIVSATFALGWIQNWLEDPGYILPVALILALSSVRRADAEESTSGGVSQVLHRSRPSLRGRYESNNHGIASLCQRRHSER